MASTPDAPIKTQSVLGNMDARTFLSHRWQRAPTFFKAALPALPPEPDWRSLAADEQVESRHILTRGDGEFELEEGPFASLPALNDAGPPWTVLLQNADYHAPELRRLFDAVRFLPHWRLEDIMMSVATAGGSVGPHVDAYDVFLVQGRGQRRWQIGERHQYQQDGSGGPLRLVRPFEPADEFLASPGDVLYLPPDVPHHGVAESDCVTYSIGFRAPTLHDLAAVMLSHFDDTARLDDSTRVPARDSITIDSATITQLRNQLAMWLGGNDAAVALGLGELVSEPKDWLMPEGSDDAPLVAGERIRLRRATRLARCQIEGADGWFANGQFYAHDPASDIIGELASSGRTLCPDDPHLLALLNEWLEDGVLRREET